MRKLICSILFGISVACIAQNSHTLKFKPQGFDVDNNRNVYFYSNQNLYKYNDNDTIPLQYSNKMFGAISSVDASNPFKILVFYKDQGIIQFLDNHLKELQPAISLFKLGFNDITLACNASDNGFWIFENTSKQLLKFDKTAKMQAASPDLSKLYDFTRQPFYVGERDNRLFLAFQGNTVMTFNISAAYVQTYYLSEFWSFYPLSRTSFFYLDTKGKATVMNFETNEFLQITDKQFDSITQMIYRDKMLYYLIGSKFYTENQKK